MLLSFPILLLVIKVDSLEKIKLFPVSVLYWFF